MLQKIRETAGPLPPPDAGNRVTLVELFTGAMCDPCVAADLALSAVLQDVPATEVVQLTYHSHIPGPDPLTCADGEGRAKYYNVEGTPTVFMNGQQVPQIGGFFLPAHIEQNFHVLRSPIEFFLKQSTDVTIEPKAEAADGQLKVHVAVRGVPDDVIGKVRLRVAVVEDDVHYVAPNGIRHHRMVVRTLVGGRGGKAANKDKGLEYSITIPLVELKARQIGYLLQMEHGKRVAFPDKPVVMKPLHLAAFVQNDATKEVLQAAMTPVAGELVYPRIEARANGEIRIVPDDPSREHPVDAPADAAPEK
jgi:glutaredoxin